MSTSSEPVSFPAGLEGVYVCNTTLSEVEGLEGRLIFNGFNAIDLAETKTFEEVWFVLREGRLPSQSELFTFVSQVEALSHLTLDEYKLVKKLRGGEPMSAFRSSLSAVANGRGFKSWMNRDKAVVDEEIMTLCALTPEIMEVLHTGRKPKLKAGNRGYADRYLWGILGKQPAEADLRALETYLILTVDHGLNASTFSSRVTVSTGADVGAALTAAVGTLSGPLHGGAPGPVLDMFDSIGSVANVSNGVAEKMAAGHLFMGFGHRVYRTDDPRSLCLKRVAERQASSRIELAKAAEAEILAALAAKQQAKALAQNVPVRTLRVNVEFWTAVVLEHVGIPRTLFSSTFCASRMIGWGEHIREQIAGNKLYRPRSYYTGSKP
ncbi:MAG: citrate synthase/methylcitrate synthase [Cyanobacteria bacterium SZAS TMP-1]|nr:citrate synthase/methylcitrate synthase [Cyanobacteria bacterium SZAS TMP-1]